MRIPVFANGGVKNQDDAQRCLEITKADGVMVGSTPPPLFFFVARSCCKVGLLMNPSLFSKIPKKDYELAREFLQICREQSVSAAAVRGFIIKMCLKRYHFHTICFLCLAVLHPTPISG